MKLLKSSFLICWLVFLLPISSVYSAQTEANGADLIPTDLTSTPQVIHSGDEITFTLSYEIQGAEAINLDEGTTITYQLTFHKAGDTLEAVGEPITGSLENLATVAGAQVTTTLKAPPAGEYLVTVELDDGNQLINEADETNNTITKPLLILETVGAEVELVVDGENKISVATTSSRFCRKLLIREKGGVPTNQITLEAQSLTNPSIGNEIEIPTLSLNDCSGSEHEIELSLEANQHRIIYLAGDLSHIGILKGIILMQHGDTAATIYSLEVSRTSRQIMVSPTSNNTVTSTTMKEQLRQPLRVDLTSGQIEAAELTYQIWLREKGSTTGADIWLELDGVKWMAETPSPDTAVFPLHLDLVANLSQPTTYEGVLTFQFGGELKELSLEITRDNVSLNIWQVPESKLALNQTDSNFEQKLTLLIPHPADPITVTYDASIIPDKAVLVNPSIDLWSSASEPINEAGFTLMPGEPTDVYLIGTLPETAVYKGELLLHFSGNNPSQRIELTFDRSNAENSGLTLSSPDQLQATTDWLVWKGISETIAFQLKEDENQSVTLLDPALTRLTLKDAENDTILTEYLSNSSAWNIKFDGLENNNLSPNERIDIELELTGLYQPGKYEAEIEVATVDGRNFKSTAVIFVRHNWILAAGVAFIGVLLAWLLQYYVKDGRSRLLAQAKINELRGWIENELRKYKEREGGAWNAEAFKFQGELPSTVWGKLLALLEGKYQYAFAEPGDTNLQTVRINIDTRHDFFKTILGLIDKIESTWWEYEKINLSAASNHWDEAIIQIRHHLNNMSETLLDGDNTDAELKLKIPPIITEIKKISDNFENHKNEAFHEKFQETQRRQPSTDSEISKKLGDLGFANSMRKIDLANELIHELTKVTDSVLENAAEEPGAAQNGEDPPQGNWRDRLKVWWQNPFTRIKLFNSLVVLVAFMIAVIVAVFTNAFGKTFGSSQDYMTLLLWGFATHSVTDGTLGKFLPHIGLNINSTNA